MQLHRNEALLRSRLRVSVVYFVASLVCLLGGFIVSSRLPDLSMQYMVSLTTLGFGMVLWWQNKVYLTRWGPKSLQDPALAQGLRGVDSRFHLFSFASARLPDYLLVGPMGVVVLLPKAVTGSVVCQDGRWSHDDGRPPLLRFAMIMSPQPSLGNPEREARDSAESVRRFLAQRLEVELADRVPVEAAVVLTDTRAKLAVQGCTTEALFLRTLRSHVRRAPRVLSNPEIDELVAALSSA